ncbi:MAG: efflux RND transporter periplasmic adaptor subunit [Aureispira sp.]|nr:efflux RND transporter periplasmic adaptor subunit [Aureispira sp.]
MAKKRRRSPVLFIVIALVIVAIIAVMMSKDKEEKGRKVATEEATNRTIIETVYASGKLFPAVEVEIASNISGTLVDLRVEEGQAVKDGDILAKVDPEALVSIVERAEAATSGAKAQLQAAKFQRDQMKAQFKNAKIVYERNKQLYEDGVISKADFQASEATFETTQANLDAAEENIKATEFTVKSSQATVKEQRKNLSQTTIRAPMNGVVSKLYKKRGEQVVGTAQMAGTPILKIANLNSIEIRVDVNERDILMVSIGDTADIELDAYPNRKFLGVVTQIANTANNLGTIQLTSDQVTNFEVRILMLPASYADLQKVGEESPFRAGLSASAEIRTNTLNNILTVPIAAVTAREDKDEKKKKKGTEEELKEYVFVVTGDSVLMTRVSTGIQDDEHIQLLTGIKQGEQIVKAPYDAISKRLESGDKVNVVDEEELYKVDK